MKIGYVINGIIQCVADSYLDNTKLRLLLENTCILLLQTASSKTKRGFKMKLSFKNRPLVYFEDHSVSCVPVDIIEYSNCRRRFFSIAKRRTLMELRVYFFSTKR